MKQLEDCPASVPSRHARLKPGRRALLSSNDHRKWVAVIRRLDEAPALLDNLDEGENDGATYAQWALDTTKKELRRLLGRT